MMTLLLLLLQDTVTIGGKTIDVKVLATREAREFALWRADADRVRGALLIRYPAERFVYLHTDRLDRGYDLVFISSEGKIADLQVLPERDSRGVTAAKPAADVLALPRGTLRTLDTDIGDEVVLPKTETVEPLDAVTFTDKDGVEHSVSVELAYMWDDRGRGLSWRTALAENEGMLFKYGYEESHSYWMRDTKMGLDVAFIRSDGTIRRIHRDMVPDTDKFHYGSDGPIQYALEVNAGWLEKHGITEGDVLAIPERVRKLKAGW